MKNLIIKISEEDFDWFKNNDIGPCDPSIFKNIKEAVDRDNVVDKKDVVDKKSISISIIKSYFESTAEKFNIPKSSYSFDPANKYDRNIICLYEDSNCWYIHHDICTYPQYGFESGCDEMLKMLLPASEYYSAIAWFHLLLIDSYYDMYGKSHD